MSNTTNHQSTSELSWLLDLPNNHTDARDIDRFYLYTKILKTESRLLGDDISYERHYISPERKNRWERIARIIDNALDQYLLRQTYPHISCAALDWAKEVIDNQKKQQLYWSLWHVASCAAREIVEDKFIVYYPAIRTMKTIYEDPTNTDKRGDLTEVVRQMVKADLKFVRRLTPYISIELDVTYSRIMELEDYVILAGCAYLLSLDVILKLCSYLRRKCFVQCGKEGDKVFHEGDTVYIEGRKRRK